MSALNELTQRYRGARADGCGSEVKALRNELAALALQRALRHLTRRARRRGHQDLEELAQDITHRFIRKVETDHGFSGTPSGYLYRMAHNGVVDLERQEQVATQVPTDPHQMTGVAADTLSADVHLEHKHRLQRVIAAMKLLPDKQCRVLTRHTQGWSIDDITEAELTTRFGWPPSTEDERITMRKKERDAVYQARRHGRASLLALVNEDTP